MNWRQSMRAVDPDPCSAPDDRQSSRSQATVRVPLRGRGLTVAIPWKPPLQLLDSLRGIIDRLIRIPRIHLRVSSREDHPGWNIVDQIELQPHSECRYLVEVVRGQAVFIGLTSGRPVDLMVCDDDEYESLGENKSWPEPSYIGGAALCDRTTDRFTFHAARTGLHDVVVSNPNGQSIDVVVRITAPAVFVLAKRRPVRETRGFDGLSLGDGRATLKPQVRKP
jgi:hypothetical protein